MRWYCLLLLNVDKGFQVESHGDGWKQSAKYLIAWRVAKLRIKYYVISKECQHLKASPPGQNIEQTEETRLGYWGVYRIRR